MIISLILVLPLTKLKMALSVDIVTPNGHSYKQPTGLFINNEFVSATSGKTITSIDPAYVDKHVERSIDLN